MTSIQFCTTMPFAPCRYSFITAHCPVKWAFVARPASLQCAAMIATKAAVFLLMMSVVTGCATAPYTKRSQFIILSDAQEMRLGADAYQEVLKKERIVRDPKVTEVVRGVGERIAAVAGRPDYTWEFNVIDDDKQINAFALPGGKVAVYTGLFPVAHDTAGLAVLRHEVGHAIAHHAAERVSQGLAVQMIGTGIGVALGSYTPGAQSAIMQAFGLGAQVGVLLPFNRAQEAEADHIGLILMATARADPS